jgi:hypothetical protein
MRHSVPFQAQHCLPEVHIEAVGDSADASGSTSSAESISTADVGSVASTVSEAGTAGGGARAALTVARMVSSNSLARFRITGGTGWKIAMSAAMSAGGRSASWRR